MRKVAENSVATALRILTAKTLASSSSVEEGSESKSKSKDAFTKVSRNVLQLLRNELKLLEMLVHACKEFKATLQQQTSSKDVEKIGGTTDDPKDSSDEGLEGKAPAKQVN